LAGANVRAYDPVALNEAKHHFGNTITYCEDQYETLINADCLAVLTEWSEFRIPNFNIMSKLLNAPAIFDGRNIYDKDEMKKNGFDYFCIGIDTTREDVKTKLSTVC
jgi:UDPglucose 6-dehydrogenase